MSVSSDYDVFGDVFIPSCYSDGVGDFGEEFKFEKMNDFFKKEVDKEREEMYDDSDLDEEIKELNRFL